MKIQKQTNRNQRSCTPNCDTSLSPLQGKDTQRIGGAKKKNLIAMPLKLQQLVDMLRSGAVENVVDLSGNEISVELASYLGNEARNWRVKTLKIMKCKLSDDAIVAFLLGILSLCKKLQV